MYDKRWELIPRIHFRGNEINEQINIKDALLKYVGTEPNKNGMIRCPSPNHEDKNPSCKVYSDHCFCFSCQQSFRTLDLASFAKGLNTRGRDFPTLCEEVCQDFGIDVYFVSNKYEREQAMEKVFGSTQQQEKKEFFPLTKDDLSVLGIDTMLETQWNKGSQEEKEKVELLILNRYEEILTELKQLIPKLRGFVENYERNYDVESIKKFAALPYAYEYDKILRTCYFKNKKIINLKSFIETYEKKYDVKNEKSFMLSVCSAIKKDSQVRKKYTSAEKKRVRAYCNYIASRKMFERLCKMYYFIGQNFQIDNITSEQSKCLDKIKQSVEEYEKTHDIKAEKWLFSYSPKDIIKKYTQEEKKNIKRYSDYLRYKDMLTSAEEDIKKVKEVERKLVAFYEKRKRK